MLEARAADQGAVIHRILVLTACVTSALLLVYGVGIGFVARYARGMS